ncbi:MAG: RNA polymerase sigma factor [Deltaproteobacteria bacterium]|nr:RNA polymerase sigma factor [Deltaproteobacteria bacterium]
MELIARMIDSAVVAVDPDTRFLAFVQSHQERAVRMAWRLLGGDAAAAEDVAQEAFLKAHRGLGDFRDDASLSTWFYRILVNEARSYRRWRGVRQRWTAIWQPDEPQFDPPAPTVEGDPILRRRLAAALERLPRGQREVFVLVHLEGFTLEQTAAQLGKALGTVKAHLHRALHHLRADLQDVDEVAAWRQTGAKR